MDQTGSCLAPPPYTILQCYPSRLCTLRQFLKACNTPRSCHVIKLCPWWVATQHLYNFRLIELIRKCKAQDRYKSKHCSVWTWANCSTLTLLYLAVCSWLCLVLQSVCSHGAFGLQAPWSWWEQEIFLLRQRERSILLNHRIIENSRRAPKE